MILNALVLLLAAQEVPALPRALSLEEPVQESQEERYPRPEPAPAPAKPVPVVDFDWLELTPAVGIAAYSQKYLADPGLAFLLAAHAPIPWLNPASDPKGDYFGLYAQAAFSTIDRKLSSSVDHRSGLASFYSLGLDYSFVRDGTWILVARGGGLYAYYGDIHDLSSGFGFTLSAVAGIQLSGKTAITYSPEAIFGKSGSLIVLNTVGVAFQF